MYTCVHCIYIYIYIYTILANRINETHCVKRILYIYVHLCIYMVLANLINETHCVKPTQGPGSASWLKTPLKSEKDGRPGNLCGKLMA